CGAGSRWVVSRHQVDLFGPTPTPEGQAFESGVLYLVESTFGCSYRAAKVTKLSVMSRAAGGEIRGYESVGGGPWQPSSPCYTGEWTALDREVERRRGITIAPYTITAGGSVMAGGVR